MANPFQTASYLDFCPFCIAKIGNFLWSHTFSPSAMQDMLLI